MKFSPGLLALAVACLMCGCGSHTETQTSMLDGVYMSCREIEGFKGEVLELRKGHYRFWHYGCSSRRGSRDDYPKCGSFSVSGQRLRLEGFSSAIAERIILDANGVVTMWWVTSYDACMERGKVNPYGVLLKTRHDSYEWSLEEELSRPSIDQISYLDRVDSLRMYVR